MPSEKFRIELCLVREDDESTTTDRAVTLATVANEKAAADLFTMCVEALAAHE